jgi:hypothetical protein
MMSMNWLTAALLAGVGPASALCAAALGQAPTNDNCLTAAVAILGVPAPFDTTNATASPEAVDPNQCAGTFLNWGANDPDVWFRWTPDRSGNVVITTCDAASFDTSMIIYTGTCSGLTQVACNGDGTGQTGCQQFYSAIPLSATAGTTYHIRIGGWTGSDGISDKGPGVILIYPSWTYACTSPAPGIPNDCATSPTIVSADGSQSFFGANAQNGFCNTDGPPHAGAVCDSGSDDLFLDRWYRVTAPATGALRVWTSGGQPDCVATADLKIAVYDMGTNPATFNYNELPNVLVDCNDEGGPCGSAPFFGAGLTATVAQGRTYLVRVGYYNATDVLNTVPQVVNFDLPETCPLQNFSVAEDEPCGENLNGGCNTDAAFPPVQIVTVGDVIGGTFFSTTTSRDTDWYQFTVNAPSQVTVSMDSRADGTVFIFDATCVPGTTGPGGTSGQTLAVSSPTAFCPIAASACLTPGTYRCVVVPAFQDLACGSSGQSNDYRLSITGAPAACPTLVSSTCTDPGPDTQVIGAVQTAIAGMVACAVNPAFPNCSGGGTTRNRFARVIPANQVLDEISCISIGVFSVRRAANAANTACASFASDIPLPAKIGIYRDTNGGAPTNAFAADGTCPDGNCDMVLVNEFNVLVPGGAYKGVINFPTPICLEDVPAGQNLVVIMDCPDLYTAPGQPGIPAASGYGIRPAGITIAGDPLTTYVRLSCVDAAAQYVLPTTFSDVFTANWALEINGTAVGCGGSACPADLNDDNFVNGSDLGILLGSWGACPLSGGCVADLNDDNFVNGADLGVLLNEWGSCTN